GAGAGSGCSRGGYAAQSRTTSSRTGSWRGQAGQTASNCGFRAGEVLPLSDEPPGSFLGRAFSLAGNRLWPRYPRSTGAVAVLGVAAATPAPSPAYGAFFAHPLQVALGTVGSAVEHVVGLVAAFLDASQHLSVLPGLVVEDFP